ncbi:hypothetical protein D9M73_212770 [compost metagenome]
MGGAIAVKLERGNITVITVLLMHHAGILHRLAPRLHCTAGVVQAGGALRQVLVFQLQAGRQQVHHQRIRHAVLSFERQVHQHKVATAQVVQVQRLAIHAQVLSVNLQAVAASSRCLSWVAGQGQLLVQRLVAFILHAQRRGQ